MISFAPFPKINSVSSNAAEFRMQSLHVVGFPMENRTPLTRRDRRTALPDLNEGCGTPQGITTRTPHARGPAVAEFKDRTTTELQRRSVTCV
jgi:hypothetical protein